jgi:1,6-anhydro-N-acetylmuramate kinase
MADTVRALSALQGLLADNTDRAISPQDLRDAVKSGVGYQYGRAVATGQALTADDRIVAATGGVSGISLILPQAATMQYKTFTVVKVDAGAGAVTLDAYGTELINGQQTYVLAAQWNRVTVWCDGTQWIVVGA